MVIKFGKWLTRHKAVVLIIAFFIVNPCDNWLCVNAN